MPHISADAKPSEFENMHLIQFISEEIPSLLVRDLDVDAKRLSIAGVGLGGFAAIVCGLRFAHQFRAGEFVMSFYSFVRLMM